jgi:predicted ATPase
LAATALRAPVTSFVGRDEDVARIGKLLDEVRLVTLTGPGGGGKTRLALASAAAAAGRMRDGVWLVELASLGEPAEVPWAALAAVGIRDGALLATAARGERHEPVDPVARLVSALHDKTALLVLDNCEHLIDAVAALTDRVLADCPRVRVLSTSREALGITGEQLWPVGPLPFPDERVGAGEAGTYPAVRLFADRAAAVVPGFEVDRGNVDVVAGICRRLDGLPLAIELAAARLRTLPAQQIATRLDDRFSLLSRGSRTALPRHQTLRAVVDWSWDLLAGQERVLLRRMSVFAAGARLPAAEQVCAGDGLAAGSVLDAMSGLVEKSLVTMTGDAVPPAQARYRMLETIRAYGLERLAEAGERDRLRYAHARYYLGLAEAAEPRLRTADQLGWMRLLIDEHDDIHAALRWLLDQGDAELALRFGAALAWYWYLRGLRTEGSRLSREILALPAAPDTAGAGPARASEDRLSQAGHAQARAICALIGAGPQWQLDGLREPLRLALAESEAAGTALHPLLSLARPVVALHDDAEEEAMALLPTLSESADPWLRAGARILFASQALARGRYTDAALATEEGVAAFRGLGERWGLTMALMEQAEHAGMRGDHEGAIAALEEAVAVSSPLGIGEDRTHLYGQLAGERMRSGDYDGARGDLAEARRVADRIGEQNPFLYVFEVELARREGGLARARELGERALGAMASIPAGFRQGRALVQASVAAVAIDLGDAAAARGLLADALHNAVVSGDRVRAAAVVEAIAGLALLDGEPQRAAMLLGAGHGLRGMPDPGSFDVLRYTATAAAALGQDAYTAAYERGRAMPPEAALALARPQLEPRG